jgi:hypothetical protein
VLNLWLFAENGEPCSHSPLPHLISGEPVPLPQARTARRWDSDGTSLLISAEACRSVSTDRIHRVPVRRRIRVRTTNLAERSFVEERRRTKVIGRFPDEHAAMKLVFATMIRAAERWCRVSTSDLERHQLKLLRAELGIDPPPACSDQPKTTGRNRAAA